MRRRFLVDSFDGERSVVRGDDAHHLRVVLRARRGQEYELSDGESVRLGRVVEVRPGEVEFALVGRVDSANGEPAIAVTLLLSIVRFARFEWALEKATELGVAGVQPVAAARSEAGLVIAAPKRLARWQKIAREAAEQSRRLRPPAIHPVESAAEIFRRADAATKVLLSERRDAAALVKLRTGEGPASVALAIGPEGGWTEEEFRAARQAGFLEASLGPTILRAETAAVAALAVVLCGWTE